MGNSEEQKLEIVKTYKKEVQTFINDENEFIPVEKVLTVAGSDLQAAFVMQRRRLRKCGLRLLFKEEVLKDSKQEGEYIKEYIQDIRRYIFESGGSRKISGKVQKTYCVKEDIDTKEKVAFVEMKDISLQFYIKKIKKYFQYYFGDMEYVKTCLEDFKFIFVGIVLTFVLGIGLSLVRAIVNNTQPIDDFDKWFWPIPCMWVIWAGVLIIGNKPGIKKKSSQTTLFSVQQRKLDFSPETFMAMATAELKSIYFAEGQEDIGAFADTDLSSFLDAHKDVVNCDLTGFIFEDFYATKDYMYMTVEQKVTLDRYRQGQIGQEEETVIVRFAKARNSIMSEDFYRDWYVTDVHVVGDNFGE